MARKVNWEKVGVVGVDSGLVFLGDPCYLAARSDAGPDCEARSAFNEQYHALIEGRLKALTGNTLQFSYALGHAGLGVLVSTRHGDGTYDVYVERDARGRVRQVKVRFDQEARREQPDARQLRRF